MDNGLEEINIPTKKRFNLLPLAILVFLVLVFLSAFYICKYFSNRRLNISDNVKSPKQDLPTATPKPIFEPINETSIRSANNSFGLNVLKDVFFNQDNEPSKSGNVFISPASISLALSMIYDGARGNTLEEMKKSLGYRNFSPDQVNEWNLKIIDSLDTQKEVNLNVANSIWLNSGFENLSLYPKFSDDLRKYYKAQSESLNFDNSEAYKEINLWVGEKTKGKIPELLREPLEKEDMMVLVNTVYFKGTWPNGGEFDERLTKDDKFFSDNGQVSSIPFMRDTRVYSYFEDGDVQAIELPYFSDKGRFSLYIYLPKKVGISDFMKDLTTKKLNSWEKNFLIKYGELILPKFEMISSMELSDTLKRIGMKGIFSDRADFMDGIVTKDSKRLKIGRVLNSASFNINERGSEASAATAVIPMTGGGMVSDNPFIMRVNKPFVFLIKDKVSGEFLFLGVVKNLPDGNR